MNRWSTAKTTTSGSMDIAAATKSSWRLTVWAVVKLARATWTVQEFSSCPMTSGHRKEFHDPMKTIAPTAANAGRALGTTMRQ